MRVSQRPWDPGPGASQSTCTPFRTPFRRLFGLLVFAYFRTKNAKPDRHYPNNPFFLSKNTPLHIPRLSPSFYAHGGPCLGQTGMPCLERSLIT